MNKSASYDDISLINVHNITLIMVFDYAKINAIARMAKLNPLQINIMKYGIVFFFVKWIYRGEHKLCIYTNHLSWMINLYKHLYNFIIKLTIDMLHTFHCQYFCGPTPWSKTFLYVKNYFKSFWTSVVTKSIGSKFWAYVKYEKNNILLSLILSQNLHFGNDDAIYDVIMREPLWKWGQNCIHEIGRDPLTDL